MVASMVAQKAESLAASMDVKMVEKLVDLTVAQ